MAKFKVSDHMLVPKHTKLSEKEKSELLLKYSLQELPRILVEDAAIVALNVKENDVILVERSSPTAGIARVYRRVVNG